MTRLLIYGIPATRAFRNLWMALELGLDYENVPIAPADGSTRAPEYLAVNPNGRVPAIDDGSFVLWESLAINLYLAKKHSTGKLYPASLEGEARAWQWSFWTATELEKPMVAWGLHAVVYPPEQRNAAIAAEAKAQLEPLFGVLDGALGREPYLLGPEFSVADLSLAAVSYRALQMDLGATPRLRAWLEGCIDRPAARAALRLREQR